MTFGTSGCPNCVIFHKCGGHPLEMIYKLGCANFLPGMQVVDTDDMNPHFEDRFIEFWNDVSGLDDYTIGKLLPITFKNFPRYITELQGRNLKGRRMLDVNIVALPLRKILVTRKDGTFGPKYATGRELRAAYNLRPNTVILLVGVGIDAPIEKFWKKHRHDRVCEALAKLGVIGVTVPNFSHFTCVPRFQVMRNRKRMLLSAERFSKAGVPVSPHLNADTKADW